MSHRYNEFRRDLIEGGATLSECESHARVLVNEIADLASCSIVTPNLRLAYAVDELEATRDHMHEIRRQMDLEEAEAQ